MSPSHHPAPVFSLFFTGGAKESCAGRPPLAGYPHRRSYRVPAMPFPRHRAAAAVLILLTH